MRTLPLLTLYVTERCNSRCITCDYWRHGHRDLSLDVVTRLLPELEALRTRTVLFSGGEPLLNPEWQAMAELLRSHGLELWLLTSGLALAKHARRVAPLFQSITVSMDGTCGSTYQAIRGLDAFDVVCEGVRAAVREGADVNLRVTLQRANYRELPRFVSLARELGARQVSFLAVDVGNPHAFARQDAFGSGLALDANDLPVLDVLIRDLESSHAEEFRSRFIAESPGKLRRIRQYFAALLGLDDFPPVRCNAPEFSAVRAVDGALSPCFFIQGPPAAPGSGVASQLAAAGMRDLRAGIRAGERRECERCVCSLWRELPGQAALSPKSSEGVPA